MLVKSFLWAALIIVALGVGMIFFFKQFIYVSPTGVQILPEARRTLLMLAGFAFLLLAGEFYLDRYALLTQGNGVVAGVSYSDDQGRLPILYIQVLIALVGAALSFIGVISPGFKKSDIRRRSAGCFLCGRQFLSQPAARSSWSLPTS